MIRVLRTTSYSRPQERLVAGHGHAIAQTAVREVIPHRVVHRRAVVPEGDRVGLPGEAALELRRLAVAVEHLEQGIALVFAQAHDVRREVAVDVERLAAGHRMGAHDRMLAARKALAGRWGAAEASAVDLGAVVHGHKSLAE